jgi:hypothetical protein
MEKLLDYDAVQAFRERALNPEHPVTGVLHRIPISISSHAKLRTAFMMQFPMWSRDICRKSQK